MREAMRGSERGNESPLWEGGRAHPIDRPVTLLAGRGDGMSVKEHVVPA